MKIGTKEFTRTKFSGLDGLTTVDFGCEGFTLKATKAGITFQGELLIEEQSELQQFAKLVSDAWTEHRSLLPKLSATLAGH